MTSKMTPVLRWVVHKVTTISRHIRRRPRRAFSVVILAVGCLALIIVGNQLAAPTHGTASHAPLPQPTRVSSPRVVTSTQAIDNQYFSMDVPPGYNLQTGSEPPARLLALATLLKPGKDGTIIITIAVVTTSGNDLSNNSDYQSRALQPEHYSAKQLRVQGEPVVAMVDVQSSGVVLFWQHGNMLATLSARSGLASQVSSDGSAELASLQPLLNSWQWR